MPNIAMLLDLTADAMGQRVAISDAYGALTYARLRQLAYAGATEVRANTNETFTFADENGPAVPVALFAAAWAGVSYAPLNYRLPAAQQQDLADRLGNRYSIETGEAGKWLDQLLSSREEISPYPADPDRPAVLLFTSGTSSKPKAAVLQHEHLLAYIFSSADFMSSGEDEAVLLAVPPFHIAGVAGMLSAIYAGRRIVPLARFTAEEWLEAVRRECVTHAFVVPTMLARIVAALEAQGGVELPSLRVLSYGGARMPVPVLERALELFPNAGFVNAYGLTETSSTVALLGPSEHRAALEGDRRRLASVGKPLPGIEIEIVGHERNPLRYDQEGRIRVRGPQVSGVYLGTKTPIDTDGWLLTGDVGTLDKDGYLYVRGRADDVIIVGGENVSPEEVEDCLLRHAHVTGALVVGIPDDEWGEQVAAMITSDSDVRADELIEWVYKHLGGLKAPKRIEICEELPMTPTGKLLRRAARDELTSA
jgi:long-chain acyl-CoA synthetase